MMKRGRWWQAHPGRWSTPIEDALASDRPASITLAWLVIMATDGQRGAVEDFSGMVGIPKTTVFGYLSSGNVPVRRIEEMAERLGLERMRPLVIGAHPLAMVGLMSPPMEPGDPGWEATWEIVRMGNPSVPSIAELRERFPGFFPPEA